MARVRALMTRRTFVMSMALAAAPVRRVSAQTGKPARVAIVSLIAPRTASSITMLEKALTERGYVEGRTRMTEFRTAGGNPARLPALAEEIVRQAPDVIIALGGSEPVVAIAHATKSIPIVFAISDDPVRLRVVASVARPGGNVTGTSSMNAELDAKRLELTKEAIPGIRRVGLFANSAEPGAAALIERVDAAGRVLGVQVQTVEIRAPAQIEGALVQLKGKAQAVIVMGVPYFYPLQQRLGALASKQGLPAVSAWRELTDAGGVMNYGTSIEELFDRTAGLADRILKGARPGDLPVEHPTRFELVINLKAARAMGLAISQSLLARADAVIQ
jgi:putative ABC transport system substrate-binding protein